jgi:hypothetical protein
VRGPKLLRLPLNPFPANPANDTDIEVQTLPTAAVHSRRLAVSLSRLAVKTVAANYTVTYALLHVLDAYDETLRAHGHELDCK